MRLWQKAACACAGVLAVAVAVCSGGLLLYARHTILDLTRQQVRAKERDLAVSFSEMANYYLVPADGGVVEGSLVNYCFSRFADETSVLMRGGEIVSSALAIDPSEWLDPKEREGPWRDREDELCFYEGRIRGRDVLMAARTVYVRSEEYAVYTVTDVTDIHRDLTVMAFIFLAVSLGTIGAGAGAVTLLMRRGARPLAALSSAARRIAGGEYGIRADIHTRDEIGALAADFNTMAQAVQDHIGELSETAERQRLFIGGAAHEFKTPLTAMLIHTRLLERVCMSEAERAESLAHIEKQCLWLESLTQKLLKVVALGRDIEKKPVLAGELAERVRASTGQVLADRGASLAISADDTTLLVDEDLMQSLLVNLVDNASKAYDPEDRGRTVWLTIRDGEIEVRDAGRGIPAQALSRIFEPFYMVDKSRSKKAGGSGLGLALAKRIADAHGARVEVQSAPGRGTVFHIWLP